jgi:hypothetical protein
MTTQLFFVLTEAQIEQAREFNTGTQEIEPRAIDHPTPGTGINLNDQTSPPMKPGNTVTLTGKYIAPKRIVDDAAYPQGMKDYLLSNCPYCLLEVESILLPPPE